MSRKMFLTMAASIALGVGAFALLAPALLLASKGVAPSEAGNLWAREVGVALLAVGATSFLLKGQGDSPALRAFLIGNALLQVGLFPLEIVAYAQGLITKLSGIVPNSLLHVVLAAGFAYFAWRIEVPGGPPAAA